MLICDNNCVEEWTRSEAQDAEGWGCFSDRHKLAEVLLHKEAEQLVVEGRPTLERLFTGCLDKRLGVLLVPMHMQHSHIATRPQSCISHLTSLCLSFSLRLAP
jgi:hypothetical protein